MPIRNAFLLIVAAITAHTYAGGTSTGNIPLNDLGPGLYEGTYQGGLYPAGQNSPPPAHAADALQLAQQIIPRDTAGNPDPDGWIVMISIGMSNTCHEFGLFERQQDVNINRNARLIIVNTAQGGQAASVIASPTAGYWNLVGQRLTALNLSPLQVQVAWLKQANAGPPDNFPIHAQELRNHLESICNNLNARFPNLRLCYLSSRIYGGYAAPGSLNPEPQAYESGFSVKWLIEDQINGDTGLNYNPAAGAVVSPLLLWGPYLWADGLSPRSDGLVWLQSDMEADNTHPGPGAEQKVAAMLGAFFAADPSAQPWWTPQAGTRLVPIDAVADAYVSAGVPGSNFGAAAQLQVGNMASPFNTYLRFDASGIREQILFAKLSLRITSNSTGGGNVHSVTSNAWNESTITFNNAPAIDGGQIGRFADCSRDGVVSAQVTSTVNADPDGLLSIALTLNATGTVMFHSKEAAQPPRLILVTAAPPILIGDLNCDGAINTADIDPFALALVDPDAYSAAFPACEPSRADTNADSQFDARDIPGFVTLLIP